MRGRAAVAILALLGIAAGMGAIPRFDRGGTTSPPASVSTPAGDAFRAGFLPLLERAASEANALVTMGESRERNLLRIRAGQNAMNDALTGVDGWLAEHPASEADAVAIGAYRDGAAHIRTGMEEAQAGFLRLDFDRVALATETMRRGAAELERAVALLKG